MLSGCLQRSPRERNQPVGDKPELLWNVLLHNDWKISMPLVVIVLKNVVPSVTLKKATRIMWEALRNG